ncbi:hypothetical protein LPJ57_002916 [Coemansia sp. RSA 486]|nr:hypothetical protein LPJ57_002916 [Coemansia sp. RSA 486]
MRGPRKTSSKMPKPGRGNSSSNNKTARGNVSKGKGKFAEPSKKQQKQTGKGKQKPDQGLDVFDAEGSDNDDPMRRRMLERVAVRDYEVENIDSEDDEEIDSDDAFDIEDAERFGGYKFNGSSMKSSAKKQTSNSDDEDSDDDLMDDFEDEDSDNIVDLSEMLDDNEDEDEKPSAGKKKQSNKSSKGPLSPPQSASASLLSFKDLAVGNAADESESEDDDSEEDDVFAGMGSDSDSDAASEIASDDIDGNEDTEKLAKLDGFVSSISARAPKRRFVEEAGDGAAEDENAVGIGFQSKGVSLGISDLLGDFGKTAADEGSDADDDGDDEGRKEGEKQSAKEIRRLRDQVEKLERAAKKAQAGVVAAPLAKRLQDQMDRKVAYDQTKKSVSEWQTTVNANRTAEHLSFPLNVSGEFNSTTHTLVNGAERSKTEMEKQISDILKQSGMSEQQQRQYEELELKDVSAEEVRKRQHELRMMRELMFRSEQKAKRIAKIKSKAYRRILKKQRLRAEDKEMERIKEQDPEMYEMLMEKMAQKRAEERMSLRHKNTGKWAKEMTSRSHGDEDRQQAMRDQLEQHDKLKRKIYDIGSDEELSDYEAGRTNNDNEASDSDADETFENARGRAISKLSAEMATTNDDAIPDDAPHKALFGMKFMQNAMQRQREDNQRDAQMLRDELEGLEADVDEDGRAVSVNRRAAAKAANKTAAGQAQGRMAFGGGVKKHDPAHDIQDDVQDGNGSSKKRVRLNEAGQIGQVASGGGHRVRLVEPVSVVSKKTRSTSAGEQKNPWLSEEAGSAAGQRSGKLRQLDRDSTQLDKLSAKLRFKRISQGTDGDAGGSGSVENVMLDVNNMMALDQPTQRSGADDDDDDDGSDSDAGGIDLKHVGTGKNNKNKRAANPNAFKQRDLVQQAFAEDEVVEKEFEAEKEALMEEEAPKAKDLTLPGWGSWGGTGIQAKKNKIVQKPAAGEGIEKSKRADSKLGSVIINHNVPKSTYKYYSTNVPFPYYTPDQYEETLKAPLGKEWNTAKSHSKMIKPRVLTKAGQIINPLAIPSKKKQ